MRVEKWGVILETIVSIGKRLYDDLSGCEMKIYFFCSLHMLVRIAWGSKKVGKEI